MYEKLVTAFDQAQHLLLTSHVQPDGDGIGSAVALAEMLIDRGKQVRIACDGPCPKRLAFLDPRNLYEEYAETSAPLDLVVVLDTNRVSRLGSVASLVEGAGVEVACIDHHQNTEPLWPLAVVDSSAPAVGTMIYALFEEMGWELNGVAAQGIYASICDDTGRFVAANAKAHQVAEACLRLGVEAEMVHRALYGQVNVELLGRVLRGSERHGSLLVQTVSQGDCEELGVDPHELDYLLDLARQVEGVTCTALLRELVGGEVRLSLRSIDGDVGAVARTVGGGGHRSAAGATLEGPIKVARTELLRIMDSTKGFLW